MVEEFCQLLGGYFLDRDLILTLLERLAFKPFSRSASRWFGWTTIATTSWKMYRKNSPRLRFSMYSALNVDTEKLGSARRELLRGGSAGS
jgi:hypothetical protein